MITEESVNEFKALAEQFSAIVKKVVAVLTEFIKSWKTETDINL